MGVPWDYFYYKCQIWTLELFNGYSVLICIIIFNKTWDYTKYIYIYRMSMVAISGACESN